MADILDLDVHQEDMAIDEADDEVGIEQLKDKARKRKGRGFTSGISAREALDDFESIAVDETTDLDLTAQRSVEGWILMVTGVHEEAHEDDVQGRFAEFGAIKNLHLNLDRRTGFLKGYALVEYENFKEAQAAKTALDGSDLLGSTINVEWSFMKKPIKGKARSRRH